MKPHQPSKGRARKHRPATVLFLHQCYSDDDSFVAKKPYSGARGYYGIWIPCSLKSARARKKALDRTLEEQIELGAKAIYELSYSAKNEPRFLKELRGTCRPVPTWEQLVAESPENVVLTNCRAKSAAVLAVTEGRG